jgi:hypothetical protein
MSQGQTDNYDAFAMDDVDADKPGSGGGGPKLPEGGYRMMILEAQFQNERGNPQIDLEVTNAKDLNLVGKSHTEYLNFPSPEYKEMGNRIAKETILAWCYAAKTTSPEEVKARQQARQGFNAAWFETIVGREVLVFVKGGSYKVKDSNGLETDEVKTTSKIEGRVWALDNPKGKGIPGHEGAAAPTGSIAPPTQTQTAPPIAPAATDQFKGLV